MNRVVPLALAALLTLPGLAAADQRSYVFTYQPITAPAGGLDLELYSTLHDPPGASTAGRKWRHQVELEYGITDRWDVSLYGVFRRPYGGDLEAEAVKARTRYRLAEPGAWPVDVVAYLEAQQAIVDGNPTKLEEKLILGRDFGRLNVALDLVAEQEFEGGEVALEWGWAAGTSWEFHPAFRLGAETFGGFKTIDTPTGSEVEVEAWAGPAVSVALPLEAGPVHGAWFAATAGFGLTDDSDDLRVRGILAFQF